MPNEVDRQPLLSTQQNELAGQLSNSASIDAKALGLLASTVAILIFIGQANLKLEWWHSLVLFAPYAVSLAYNLLAIYPRKYVAASVNTQKHPEYLAMDGETLVLQLIADTELALAKNGKLNQLRWRYCALAFLLALLGTLVLLIMLAVQ